MSEINIQKLFNETSLRRPIYEDTQCIVFDEELNPQAPIHFLVLPKRIIPRLSQASTEDEKLLGSLLSVARKVAKQKGLSASGFRVVVNDGANGGQTINQLCVQVLGGRQMTWPFGHLMFVANKIAVQKGFNGGIYDISVVEDPKYNKVLYINVIALFLKPVLSPVVRKSKF